VSESHSKLNTCIGFKSENFGIFVFYLLFLNRLYYVFFTVDQSEKEKGQEIQKFWNGKLTLNCLCVKDPVLVGLIIKNTYIGRKTWNTNTNYFNAV